MLRDRPADLRPLAAVHQRERAVEIREAFVEPQRHPRDGVRHDHVGVFVEDDALADFRRSSASRCSSRRSPADA